MNNYLQLKQADNGGKPYHYAERKGKDSVAFILKHANGMYGLIQEFKPPLQEWLITAYGGSIDSHKSLTDIVLQEVQEEAGYLPYVKQIQFLGKHFVSTQMNQFCYLFLVPVESIQEMARTTTDSGEMKSQPVWLDKHQVLTTQCWKAKTILLMSEYGKGIKYV